MTGRLLILAVLGLLAPAGGRSPAEAHPSGRVGGWRVDPSWPQKPADVKWGEMPGVAVDRQDRVWIFTRAAPYVQTYAADGTFVGAWKDFEYGRAHHLKFDPEGNLWLADIGLHTVRKHGPDGKLLLSLGTPGKPGVDESHFDKPTDMAITPAGDVFISDGYGNNRVVHFDKSGKFVKAWGKKGRGPGEFDLPHWIGVDSKGLLYVADRNNARIQVFEQSGRFVAEWKDLLVPWNIWITPKDEIWSCGSTPTLHKNEQGMTGIPPPDQVFMKFDGTGRVLQVWCPPKGVDGQEKPGDCNWVHAIALDSKGAIYAGDIKGMRVQKFLKVD
jgi:hypothetical protein